MLEGRRVARYVFTLLAADTGPGGASTLVGGRIYARRAPQSVVLPALVVQQVSSVTVTTLGGVRVFANNQTDVRAIFDGGNTGQMVAIGDRVDAVLQGAGGLQDGARVVKLVKTDELEMDTDEAGKPYAHLIQTFGTPAHALS